LTDARSQALLEFPEIRSRLAALTAFSPSRRLAEALSPSSDPVIVARQLDETDQARAVLAERASVGVGGARDIAPWIGRAARGGRLETDALEEV
jgi:dsDNA-specific endonuclease/ATPase MutS2